MRTLLLASLAVMAVGSARAQTTEAELRAGVRELESLKSGGTFKPVENQHRLWGCSDKGKLMFIERMWGGDKIDQENANLIAARDCDTPNIEGRYTRCAASGFVFPRKGGRATFSGYCRVGRSDPPVFIRDDIMQAVPAVATPQDCKAFVDRIAGIVCGKLDRDDDTEYRIDLLPPLAGKGKWLNNYASVTCEPWAELKWNSVGLHWNASNRPPPKYFEVLNALASLKTGEAVTKSVQDCLRKARKGERDAVVRTAKTHITCNADKDSVSVYVEQAK